ncbi:unnamed protein product [Arabis nemorensis]|uniref:RRM domain-containing protein n=1 Tax=Arabis nemorensis TaxID=586526 RepID=A0A565AWL0_9BRAS|nr:unnamed protein product [Arabis nemorensis]
MQEIADSLKRIEGKVDLLATKVDLLARKAELHVEKVAAKNTLAMAASDSDDSSDNSSSDDEPAKKLAEDDEKVIYFTSHSSYVLRFDSSLPEHDIKTALSKHFGSCGEITRVSVPRDHETAAIKGFAYIDMKEEGVKKALELNGSDMTGSELVVEKVIPRDIYRSGGESFGRVGGRFGNVGGRFAGGRCGGLQRCGRC